MKVDPEWTLLAVTLAGVVDFCMTWAILEMYPLHTKEVSVNE